MAAASSLRKVLVVIGTTGAGKTKLSIDLAKAVGGEIINSDAMQVRRLLAKQSAFSPSPYRCALSLSLSL